MMPTDQSARRARWNAPPHGLLGAGDPATGRLPRCRVIAAPMSETRLVLVRCGISLWTTGQLMGPEAGA